MNALERRFPATNGYGTLFPSRKHGNNTDTGLIKAFAKFYADNTIFPPATELIPWNKLPPPFLADRGAVSKFHGTEIITSIKSRTASWSTHKP